MSVPEDIAVSVVMITYNHDEFIEQAIESILQQQTEFNFEVVIGEDCSTDTTRRICEQVAERYPDRIRLLPSEKNLGVNRNFLRTVKAAKGRFVAFCEGDDYWSDSLKIQKQYDFLTGQPEFVMSTHDAMVIRDGEPDGKYSELEGNKMKSRYKRAFTTEDTFAGWFLHTATMMHRNVDFQHPDFLLKVFSLDVAYISVLSQFGKIGYMEEVMSCYRKHPGGISFSSHSKGNYYLNWLEMYDALDAYFDFKFHPNIQQAKKDNCYWYFEKVERESNELRSKLSRGELSISAPMLGRILKHFIRRKLTGSK